jgi:hypothetical protein
MWAWSLVRSFLDIYHPGSAVDASDASLKIGVHIDNLFWDNVQGSCIYSMDYIPQITTFIKSIIFHQNSPHVVLRDGSLLRLGSLHLQGMPGKALSTLLNF